MRKLMKNNLGLIMLVFGMLFFRTAIADWSPVPTGSMEPTILPGDVLLIDKTILGPAIPFTESRLFHRAEPGRGDIITFTPPHTDETYVKRVIGIPGDRIRTDGLRVFVNGEVLPLQVDDPGLVSGLFKARETIAGREHAIQVDLRRNLEQVSEELVVPDEAYFVMGDNRTNSVDSRFWGFVRADKILGTTKRLAVSVATDRRFFGSLGVKLD